VAAHRLFADKRVRAAVREVAQAEIAMAEPELLATTWGIVRDIAVAPRDRLRAASMLWDRCNPVVTKTQVDVSHHLTVEELDQQHHRALLKLGAPEQAFLDRFGPNGLQRVKALVDAADRKANAIEAEYQEVITDE
jgi:hypothetical protein